MTLIFRSGSASTWLDLLEQIFGEDHVALQLLGHAFEPRGQVHGVADHRVLHALGVAHVARDHLAGVQADAGADLG